MGCSYLNELVEPARDCCAPVFIYVLVCPFTDEPRYIGKTTKPASRLIAHIAKAKTNQTNHYCARWIRGILKRNSKPELRVIFQVPDGDDWQEHERRLIAEYKERGTRLTNTTAGGGCDYKRTDDAEVRRLASWKATLSDPDKRKKWSDNIKAGLAQVKEKKSKSMKDAWENSDKRNKMLDSMRTTKAVATRSAASKRVFAQDGYKKKFSQSVKNSWFNADDRKARQSSQKIVMWAKGDFKARVSKNIKAGLNTPHAKTRLRAAAKEINSRPEVKQARSKWSKARWENDQSRLQLLNAFSSPEVKAKQSTARKAAWADPEVGKKLRAIHSSPEVRKKKSDAAKRRATPEYRAMMSEKRRLAWARQKSATSSVEAH